MTDRRRPYPRAAAPAMRSLRMAARTTRRRTHTAGRLLPGWERTAAPDTRRRHLVARLAWHDVCPLGERVARTQAKTQAHRGRTDSRAAARGASSGRRG